MVIQSRETLYRSRERVGADGYAQTQKQSAFITDVFTTHARARGEMLFFGRVFSSQPDELRARGQICWDGRSTLRAIYWWQEQMNGIFIESTTEVPYHQAFNMSGRFNALQVISWHNRTELSFGNVALKNHRIDYESVSSDIPEKAGDLLVVNHIDKFTCGKIARIDKGVIPISAA